MCELRRRTEVVAQDAPVVRVVVRGKSIDQRHGPRVRLELARELAAHLGGRGAREVMGRQASHGTSQPTFDAFMHGSAIRTPAAPAPWAGRKSGTSWPSTLNENLEPAGTLMTDECSAN